MSPEKKHKQIKSKLEYEVHTVGPANREVPESAIAEQPPPQYPAKKQI